MFKLLMNSDNSIITIEHDFPCSEALADALIVIIDNVLQNEYRHTKGREMIIKNEKIELSKMITSKLLEA